MANHKYTSLSELLDAAQRRTPYLSHDSEYNSDDSSLLTEMFGELYFRERTSPPSSPLSIWDCFNPPLPPPRALPNLPSLHDHAEVQGLNENPHLNGVQGLNEGADSNQVAGLNENGNADPVHGDMGLNEDESSQNQVQGLNEGFPNPDLENGNETDESEGKKILTENNSCKYDNSGKLFPPLLSTLKINRPGPKPIVYQEFDAEKTEFVGKNVFLPHDVMTTSRSRESLRRSFTHHELAAAGKKK